MITNTNREDFLPDDISRSIFDPGPKNSFVRDAPCVYLGKDSAFALTPPTFLASWRPQVAPSTGIAAIDAGSPGQFCRVLPTL